MPQQRRRAGSFTSLQLPVQLLVWAVVGSVGCAGEMNSAAVTNSVTAVQTIDADADGAGTVVEAPGEQTSSGGNSAAGESPRTPASTAWQFLALSRADWDSSDTQGDAVFVFSKAQPGFRVVTCRGQAWDVDAESAKMTPVAVPESPQAPTAGDSSCLLQVASQTYWQLESGGGKLTITRWEPGASEQAALSKWTTVVDFPGAPSTLPRPLALTEDRLVFFVDGRMLFFAWDKGNDGSAKTRLKLDQFQWDAQKRGTAVTAGVLGPHFWLMTKDKLHMVSPQQADGQGKVTFSISSKTVEIISPSAQAWAATAVRSAGVSFALDEQSGLPASLGPCAFLLGDGLYLSAKARP